MCRAFGLEPLEGKLRKIGKRVEYHAIAEEKASTAAEDKVRQDARNTTRRAAAAKGLDDSEGLTKKLKDIEEKAAARARGRGRGG